MTLAQKSDRILAQTRGLSGATPNATQLIEELRSALEENRREVARLTAERDEARRDAERWQADALRLIKERNAAMEERDEARRMYCGRVSRDVPLDAFEIAKNHEWDCFKEDGK
jgi:chromosome segregation ATPase